MKHVEKLKAVVVLQILIISMVFLSEMVVFLEAAPYYDFCSPKGIVIKEKVTSDAVLLPIKEDAELSEELKYEVHSASFDKNKIIEFICDGTCKNVTLYDYLTRVVMSEVPYTFNTEAIKAQAVAARSYALYLNTNSSKHKNGALCSDPSHCSAGLSREEYIDKYGSEAYEKAYIAVTNALDETDGEILKYDGEVCLAVYHASSSGSTENSYDVWGTHTPYLMSVSTSEICDAQVVSMSCMRVHDLMKKYRYCDCTNTDVPANISLEYTDSGRIKSVNLFSHKIKGSAARTLFGLKSSDFTIRQDGDKIIFEVYGYGHGIGMSQIGAQTMADGGYTYDEILCHYYSGAEIVRI